MKKINWGTGIVAAFALFISFILYFVVKVQTNSAYDNELVIDEYYKHDTRYSEEMAMVQNAADLAQKPVIAVDEQGIRVTFPPTISTRDLQGNISLYRPSGKKLDFERKLSLAGSSMLIPKTELAGGRWDITLYWEFGGEKFKLKKTAYLP